MKKETFIEWLIGAAVIAPSVYLSTVWTTLPEQVPMHFNLSGEVDRMGHKSELWLPVLLLTVLIWGLLKFLPAIDPKQKLKENPEVLQNIRLIISLFTSAMAIVVIHAAQTNGKGIDIAIPLLTGAMLAGLGNYLINVKPNYFVGIRTPWTLESESVWRKTHRLGGRMIFAGGIATVFCALIFPGKASIVIMTVLVTLTALIPVVMSYVYFRREKSA